MRLANVLRRFGLPIVLASTISAALAEDVSPPVATATAGVIAALRARDVAAIEGRFSPTMHDALPHDKFAPTMTRIFDVLGALRSCDEPRVQSRDGLAFVELRCAFEKSPTNVRMAWTDSMQLAGLLITPAAAP